MTPLRELVGKMLIFFGDDLHVVVKTESSRRTRFRAKVPGGTILCHVFVRLSFSDDV